MTYRLKILRGTGSGKSRWQTFETPCTGSDSVARALEELNEREVLTDSAGETAAPIAWDCACLEKKCGACAMVIGGTPALACATALRHAADKRGVVTLAPLTKFPRLQDLRVDRKKLFETMTEMELWLEQRAAEDGRNTALHYKAAGCLMCGLCMEVCPNFDPKGTFAGAAAAAGAYRVLDENETGGHEKNVENAYVRRFFEGCAKSLACQRICPAGVPIEQLLVKTNAAAVWHRKERKK